MPKPLLPVSTTPFPNSLLDDVMPTLSDTEWRILCVIVRQTLGWQSNKRDETRKECDWLTHRQLLVRTGRASAAVSRAIQGLIQKKRIVIEDEEGQVLSCAKERREHRGRLYFRLHPTLLSRETNGSDVRSHTEQTNTFSQKEEEDTNKDTFSSQATANSPISRIWRE